MMSCDEVLDQMVERAVDPAGLTTEAEAHLAGCLSCRLNWQLIRAAPLVGQRAAQAIDPERLAGQVVGRLNAARRSDQRRRLWGGGGLLAAAAAVALMVYSGGGTSHPLPDPTILTSSASDFTVPVSGLDDLDTDQLQTVFDQLDGALSGQGSVAAPHLEELSPDEMEQVLNSLEG